MTSVSLHPSATVRFVRNGLARIRLFMQLLRNRVSEDELFTQAAALAYNTLFSLLPLLVLALLVISMISGKSGDLGSQTQTWLLQQFGLNQIQVEVEGEPVNINAFLASRIEAVRGLVQSPGTSLLAFATLLYGAASLMLVIEKTFNDVYRAPKARAWSRRVMLYWSILTLGPLGVAGSIMLTRAFHGAAGSVVPSDNWILAPLSLLGGLAVSWVLVFAMYRLIPETHVSWKSAVVGAFVGAALWELGKYGMGVYVRTSVGYGRWYGNLGLVPLFMFWIYLTWIFLLIGLQITYVHQYYEALARQLRFKQVCTVPVADIRWVLPLAVLLYHRFKAGRPLATEEAGEEIGIPPDVAEQLLAALAEQNLVHLVEGKKGYVLARPPEEIRADQLLTAARSLCESASEESTRATDPAFAPGVAEFRDLETQWAKSHTLADLAARKP